MGSLSLQTNLLATTFMGSSQLVLSAITWAHVNTRIEHKVISLCDKVGQHIKNKELKEAEKHIEIAEDLHFQLTDPFPNRNLGIDERKAELSHTYLELQEPHFTEAIMQDREVTDRLLSSELLKDGDRMDAIIATAEEEWSLS